MKIRIEPTGKALAINCGAEFAVESLLNMAPVDFQKYVEEMQKEDLDETRRLLEGIAERCAFLAGYLDERYGYGCGDQGHEKAVKTGNKHSRAVWMKVFGYNAHHNLNI